MKTLTQGTTDALPTTLPPAGAHLYGYVDTTIAGWRSLEWDLVLYTLSAGNYRGDALAAALVSAGVPASLSNGLFSVGAGSNFAISYVDRLGYLLGLARMASTRGTPAANPHISTRISPVAIPLAGFVVRSHEVRAEDEVITDRLQRDIGYVYGAARVLTITATMHRWSLDALLEGWCMTGRVAFVGPNATGISSSNPEGSALGVRILSVSAPKPIGAAQLWAEVSFVVAMEEP